ncbi:MAG: hypothetical protein NTX50_23755 [Candidatus Sumerlaeota bacterium]|nr:hypothetical protein [Candidatus Sumerlaeota bacterium]
MNEKSIGIYFFAATTSLCLLAAWSQGKGIDITHTFANVDQLAVDNQGKMIALTTEYDSPASTATLTAARISIKNQKDAETFSGALAEAAGIPKILGHALLTDAFRGNQFVADIKSADTWKFVSYIASKKAIKNSGELAVDTQTTRIVDCLGFRGNSSNVVIRTMTAADNSAERYTTGTVAINLYRFPKLKSSGKTLDCGAVSNMQEDVRFTGDGAVVLTDYAASGDKFSETLTYKPFSGKGWTHKVQDATACDYTIGGDLIALNIETSGSQTLSASATAKNKNGKTYCEGPLPELSGLSGLYQGIQLQAFSRNTLIVSYAQMQDAQSAASPLNFTFIAYRLTKKGFLKIATLAASIPSQPDADITYRAMGVAKLQGARVLIETYVFAQKTDPVTHISAITMNSDKFEWYTLSKLKATGKIIENSDAQEFFAGFNGPFITFLKETNGANGQFSGALTLKRY